MCAELRKVKKSEITSEDDKKQHPFSGKHPKILEMLGGSGRVNQHFWVAKRLKKLSHFQRRRKRQKT